MKGYIDLHTHTVFSDGSMTPEELVRLAAERGLRAVAVTDHDTVGGIARETAAGKEYGVETVPGVELSAKSDAELHILGYYIDPGDPDLIYALGKSMEVRAQRSRNNCDKLRALGYDVTMEEAREIAGKDMLCRAHFAKLLVKKGYCGSVKEAFDTLLGFGKPAYDNSQYLSARDAVEVINAAGGLAFAAHLHHIDLEDGPLEEFLKELKGYGLAGVEGIYTEYTEQMRQRYQAIAGRLGLALSGGTDFHGAMKPHISLGTGLGDLRIPYEILENIKTIKGERQ